MKKITITFDLEGFAGNTPDGMAEAREAVIRRLRLLAEDIEADSVFPGKNPMMSFNGITKSWEKLGSFTVK